MEPGEERGGWGQGEREVGEIRGREVGGARVRERWLGSGGKRGGWGQGKREVAGVRGRKVGGIRGKEKWVGPG